MGFGSFRWAALGPEAFPGSGPEAVRLAGVAAANGGSHPGPPARPCCPRRSVGLADQSDFWNARARVSSSFAVGSPPTVFVEGASGCVALENPERRGLSIQR